MDVYFVVKYFADLSPLELYQCLQLRSEVFVVEQQCVYQDLDNKDFTAHHLLAYYGNEIVGYARLLPKQVQGNAVSIGRVASAKSFRSMGLGMNIMKRACEECQHLFGQEDIEISAQVYAVGFYEKLGFSQVGKEYLEDDIPHIKMIKKN